MIKIANAPCSWGVLEFAFEGQTAGYVRVLDEIRETGYAGTELGDWGFLPTEPVLLSAELQRHDLVLLGAFVPVAFKDPSTHATGIETAVRTARLLADVQGNLPFIILADNNGTVAERTRNAGRIRPEHGLSSAAWQVFASGVQAVAEAVKRETGLRTVFHHHCGGYVETPAEIERLMNLTDPSLLGLCFDSGHYRFGGGDTLEGLKKFGPRVWHFHFKDCQPDIRAEAAEKGWDYFEAVQHGVFCELGQGDVPFPALVAELDRMGYEGWGVVEQDVLPGMGTPLESARRNRQYLKSIGL